MSHHSAGEYYSQPSGADDHHPQLEKRRALLGAEGQEYILTKLSSGDPKSAITSFQKQFSSLSSAAVSSSIPPILELTDLLNVQRNNLFFGLMNHLKKILLDKIENENEPIQEEELLEQIFPYIGFEELRPIVYTLLKRMEQIPVTFLQQLQANTEIFKNLPIEVKRQVWVNDENLFIKHISTLLKKYDVPQIHRTDLLSGYKIDPKKKREKNQTLTSMINILGKDPILYHRVLGYCRSQLLTTGSRHFCTFRYDLLMALHDNQVQQLHQMDMCHYFCWWLDAWIRTVHANLLNYVFVEHSEDIRNNLTYSKLTPTLGTSGSSGSLTSATASTATKTTKKPKKGGKTGKAKIKKEEPENPPVGQQATDVLKTDSKQQIVVAGIDSENLTLKDFFDIRRMKELRHFFDNVSPESEVWGDIAVICRSPFISNTLLQQIFYLLEFIYSQHPNMPSETLDRVLLSIPIKQKNKRKATEQQQEEISSSKKKTKVKATKEPTVNTNTKGTTIKISFKPSESASSPEEETTPTPVPTTSQATMDTSPVPTVSLPPGALPAYLSFLEDAHNVNDFAEYIETLTRLYYAGEKAQSMLKGKMPFQLPPLPDYLFEFYPFIQRLLFSTEATPGSNVTIDIPAFQEQFKKHSLARKLLLFSVLRFHQNARIANCNLHRTISGYDISNEHQETQPKSQAEQKKKDDDIEKFRSIDTPHDGAVYAANLNKFRYLFKALFLEGNTTELSLFAKTVIQREFNFIDSLIADCTRLVKDIHQYSIPVLLSGNIKWFFTDQLSELVDTYSMLFENFVIPYICFTKQESLSFQISVSTCLKEIASLSHLMGSILLTIPKEVFAMREKKDDEDIDDENKKCIHSFDEYKEKILSLKNFCQNILQQLKNVTLSDAQLSKLFQSIETQLAKEWKALQSETKSLLQLQQEQETLEKAKKEKSKETPSTPSPFPFAGKVLAGTSPFAQQLSPFGKPVAFPHPALSSLSPSQIPKFHQVPTTFRSPAASPKTEQPSGSQNKTDSDNKMDESNV
ncbi:hypothetical protein FDP41_012835 [Naegleria fowleri]|uniref:Uncharacterized protein n=1 Tax=Naegleria fowleri TaxID=5763 RepID=A0A6A5BV04_NAEFO|nr:uncharacterized protein FDP41_012835 [Naegleria fowleri]KAF0981047.1 hypothetical protein FDP41_012835 [Naegleria fowleri]CAG4709032.1 unnamed protein product [Naegleria fowleri]